MLLQDHNLVKVCTHKSGRCAVGLYHAPHLWYSPFYTSLMASSALQHWTASLQKKAATDKLVETRSCAVAKRPCDASCLYSFYTLEWCGYPMVKKFQHMFIRFDMIHEREKIAIFTYRSPHFCFPWRRLCDYHAICYMDGKTIQCLPKPSPYVPIYLQ